MATTHLADIHMFQPQNFNIKNDDKVIALNIANYLYHNMPGSRRARANGNVVVCDSFNGKERLVITVNKIEL